ncbi:39S ribosomal protein L54, mitochondrial [Orchesella cincta]|uniref:Large ribosomal subunit protein mL54 n=1 Tax=Orchesella cincta TaxID=48709 RepID=A0A1D2NB96_ORCCI|nr:39S ribosomal protein L54, mitochondrial [Orchesella cincta]
MEFNSKRNYAKPAVGGIVGLGKKKLGKAGPMLEKKVLPVETDTTKLVNYCCGSNFMKEGEDIRLGDDSEYPDWLWTMNTGGMPTLDQLDPDTEEYWERVKQIANKRSTSLQSLRKF